MSNRLDSVKRGPLKSLMSMNMPECKEMSCVIVMLSGCRLLYVLRKSLEEYMSSKIAIIVDEALIKGGWFKERVEVTGGEAFNFKH